MNSKPLESMDKQSIESVKLYTGRKIQTINSNIYIYYLCVAKT